MVTGTRLEEMAVIQAAKEAEADAGQLPLDAEGAALAEGKRETFDLPINVAKTDPLR